MNIGPDKLNSTLYFTELLDSESRSSWVTQDAVLINTAKKAIINHRIDIDLYVIEKESTLLEKLTSNEVRHICKLAEKMIFNSAVSDKSCYLNAKSSNVARAIIVDFAHGSFSILLKKWVVVGEGSSKKATLAIEILIAMTVNEPAELSEVVRLVNKTGACISNRELQYEQRYGDMRSLVTYTGNNNTNKTSYTQDDYLETLDAFIGYSDPVSYPCELLTVCKRVGHTLKRMHADGVVHRDLKASNVLYSGLADLIDQVRLADFGMTYAPFTEPRPGKIKQAYGTATYTAPEKNVDDAPITDKAAHLQQAKAEDMFALGCLLYELIFKHPIPWGVSMAKAFIRHNPVFKDMAIRRLQQEHDSIKRQLNTHVDGPEKQFLQLVIQLLSIDPMQRPTIDLFLEKIATIQGLLTKSTGTLALDTPIALTFCKEEITQQQTAKDALLLLASACE